MFKSQNKKPEDQSKKILNANNEETKRNLCIKQIAYFQYKKTKESCSFDFDKYLLLIKDFETSSSIINKVIWVQTVNEILQVKNISIKPIYYNSIWRIIFEKDFDDITLKLSTINLLTENCNHIDNNDKVPKIYIKKIILFLVNECLLKNSTSSLLKNIYNYLTSTNSSSFESILDFLIDVLICYCINDISIFIQMKSMLDNQSNSKARYDELKAKIESSIDIFNYFFFTYTVSRTQNKYLIYIIIILSFYHYINKDKAFSEVCKFINFRHQNNLDFLIKQIAEMLNLVTNEKKFNDTVSLYDSLNDISNIVDIKLYDDFKVRVKSGMGEKINSHLKFIVSGATSFIVQLMEIKCTTDSDKGDVIICVIDTMKTIAKYPNKVKSLLNLLIDKIGMDVDVQWEEISDVIIDIFLSDEKTYEELIFRLYRQSNLKNITMNRMILNKLLYKKNIFMSNALNDLNIKAQCDSIVNFSIKAEKIIIDAMKKNSIDVIKLVLSYIRMYKESEVAKRIIDTHYKEIIAIGVNDDDLIRRFSATVIAILISTDDMKFFKDFITKTFLQKNSDDGNEYKISIIFRKIIQKTIKKLDDIDNTTKLSIIFNLLFDFSENFFSNDNIYNNDYIISNIIHIFTKIKILSLSSSIANSIDFDKKKNFVFRLLSALHSDIEITLKENIIVMFAKQLNSLFFFYQVDLSSLIDALFPFDLEHYIERINLFEDKMNLLTNISALLNDSTVILNNSKDIIVSIIKHLIGEITTVFNQIFSNFSGLKTSLFYITIMLFVFTSYASLLDKEEEINEVIENAIDIIIKAKEVIAIKPSFGIAIALFAYEIIELIQSSSKDKILFVIHHLSDIKKIKSVKKQQMSITNYFVSFLIDCVISKATTVFNVNDIINELTKSDDEELTLSIIKWISLYGNKKRSCELTYEKKEDTLYYIGNECLIAIDTKENCVLIRTPILVQKIIITHDDDVICNSEEENYNILLQNSAIKHDDDDSDEEYQFNSKSNEMQSTSKRYIDFVSSISSLPPFLLSSSLSRNKKISDMLSIIDTLPVYNEINVPFAVNCRDEEERTTIENMISSMSTCNYLVEIKYKKKKSESIDNILLVVCDANEEVDETSSMITVVLKVMTEELYHMKIEFNSDNPTKDAMITKLKSIINTMFASQRIIKASRLKDTLNDLMFYISSLIQFVQNKKNPKYTSSSSFLSSISKRKYLLELISKNDI